MSKQCCLDVVHMDTYYSKVGKGMRIFENLEVNHGDLNKRWKLVFRYFLLSTAFKFQNSNQSTNCLLNILDRVFLLLTKGTWELNTSSSRPLPHPQVGKKPICIGLWVHIKNNSSLCALFLNNIHRIRTILIIFPIIFHDDNVNKF